MEDYDYFFKEPSGERSRVYLLGDDYEEAGHISPPKRQTLARLASAIHAAAPSLTAEELEQAVVWLKTWKLEHQAKAPGAPRAQDSRDFQGVLRELRESPEQGRLQRQAYDKTLAARVLAALIGAVVLGGLAVGALVSWFWLIGCLVIAAALFIWSDKFVVQALVIAKEQEKRHMMASFRAAETVDTLAQAGWFTYLPGLKHPDYYHWLEDGAALRLEIYRLQDVTYRDPERWLDE
jgi:hypothetical protein